MPAFGFGDGPGGVDEPDVAEGLGEVAEQFTGGRVDFLGEQVDVVEVGDGTLEDVPCPRGLAGQGLGQPEGAQHEGALPAFQAVGSVAGAIAVDQAAFVGEALGDGVDSGQHAGSVAGPRQVGDRRDVPAATAGPNRPTSGCSPITLLLVAHHIL